MCVPTARDEGPGQEALTLAITIITTPTSTPVPVTVTLVCVPTARDEGPGQEALGYGRHRHRLSTHGVLALVQQRVRAATARPCLHATQGNATPPFHHTRKYKLTATPTPAFTNIKIHYCTP